MSEMSPDQRRKALVAQRRVHEVIRRTVHSEIPAQQMSILYLVNENEGITHGEIAQRLTMPQATVSRNVSKLSTKLVEGRDRNLIDVGYGLLKNRDDIVDPRRNAVYVTDKGREVLTKIAETFLEGCQAVTLH
jgi:DNA-binding MarR family transcriptional regulator